MQECSPISLQWRLNEVPGLWRYWQRRLQPARNTMKRMPGPSTLPQDSIE